MLHDGTYCRADELTEGISLMSLYTKYSNIENKSHVIGIEQIKQNSMAKIGNFVISDGNELNAENYRKKVQELHARVSQLEKMIVKMLK